MRLFRPREETLNEQLLREAGLDQAQEAVPDTAFPVTQPDQDVVTTVHAARIAGNEVQFATLPGGDVIVDEEQGDADLSPFADAVEQSLQPPYRVAARRQDGDRWTLAARRIDVVEFAFDGGDELELVCRIGEKELQVDGKRSAARIPQLERAGERHGAEYAVHAERLDGDLWEIQAEAL